MLSQLNRMLKPLPDTALQELNHQHRGSLSSNSQRLGHYIREETAMGGCKYLN
jgi:hypothetical protein